jgi:polyketide synthase 12
MLLGQLDLGPADLDMLAIQLTAALDGPLLLYLSSTDLAVAPDRGGSRITRGWQDLIRRVARP